MLNRKTIFSAFTVGGFLLCVLAMPAQDKSSSPAPLVRGAIAFDVSPSLRELARVPSPLHYGFHRVDRLHSEVMSAPDGAVVDPVEQSSAAGTANYAVGLNLVGVNDLGVGILPSDANLAVGDTQVVQWVNVSYSVYDKTTGALQLGPIEGSQLWAGFGGYCATSNDGDVIAQWDKAAHRWVLYQSVIYSNPATACFAISTTPDATGTYYRFAFPLYNQNNDDFPDYPKLGTWTNSYVQTQNNFGNSSDHGSNPCVYDRTTMLNGDPSAQQVCFQLTVRDSSLLPADIDSNTPPPAGQACFSLAR